MNNLSKLYQTVTKRHYRPSKLFKRRRVIISVFLLSLTLLILFPIRSLPVVSRTPFIITNIIYSFLIACSLIINIIILRPISSKKWTYIKEVLLVLNTISLSLVLISLITYLIFPNSISKDLIIEVLIKAFVFGFFIYITLSFFTLLRYVLNKTPLNIGLSDTLLIQITGKNKNEQLLIPIKNLLYIKSEGHYINIFYLLSDINDVKSILFRENISNIQKKLTSYETLYRCHKSYLINISHIKYINSYRSKTHIVLKSKNCRIPVSTNKAKYLAQQINSKKHHFI
ncbi:DNA-binding response regulator, LytR/AlgR family [Tenacibaculum sp. MAR_2009_124]|uniref:LytR/AlgR family response regulator transcription factor n=1 Tax=Tenacibaculum sp. MAR_2009_124 TaxID=1250059 RepID=UPI000897A2F7|nr:DNA-binding response regulator, LytR/AlgR family [Tenacibaculum sp. MAR_2009_124]